MFQGEKTINCCQMQLEGRQDEDWIDRYIHNEKSLVTLTYLLSYVQVSYRHHNLLKVGILKD